MPGIVQQGRKGRGQGVSRNTTVILTLGTSIEIIALVQILAPLLTLGKMFYSLNINPLTCTRLLSAGRINGGNVYKTPDIVPSAL